MNFISIKNHEVGTWYFFYFQVRESPAPLNIPTPNPATDHLLGGHNEVGGNRAQENAENERNINRFTKTGLGTIPS